MHKRVLLVHQSRQILRNKQTIVILSSSYNILPNPCTVNPRLPIPPKSTIVSSPQAAQTTLPTPSSGYNHQKFLFRAPKRTIFRHNEQSVVIQSSSYNIYTDTCKIKAENNLFRTSSAGKYPRLFTTKPCTQPTAEISQSRSTPTQRRRNLIHNNLHPLRSLKPRLRTPSEFVRQAGSVVQCSTVIRD